MGDTHERVLKEGAEEGAWGEEEEGVVGEGH